MARVTAEPKSTAGLIPAAKPVEVRDCAIRNCTIGRDTVGTVLGLGHDADRA